MRGYRGVVIVEPIARGSVADEVFSQISRQILDHTIGVGEALPSERKLAEAFGVSRPVVREALRKLEQAGLITVRQGDATSVRDFRRHAGPELLPLLIAPGGRPDSAVIGSVLEARQAIGAEVAALAARRYDRSEAGIELDSLVDQLATQADSVEKQRIALHFWERIVDAADALAYRLIFNSLRNVYEPAMAALAAVMMTEIGRTDLYRELVAAIVAGDETAARNQASVLLCCGTTAFADVLTAVDSM